jgi:hypothetical protein
MRSAVSTRLAKTCSILALAISAGAGVDVAAEPIAIGAVESYDLATNSLTVLGQRYALRSLQPKRPLSAGDIVEVHGKLSSNGVLSVSTLVSRRDQNVPGSTVVQLTGRVSATRAEIAEFEIGDLVVDFSATLYAVVPSGEFAVGEIVRVIGTQPLPFGTLIASEVEIAGIGGTGRESLGIGGTGRATLGIGGTGSH